MNITPSIGKNLHYWLIFGIVSLVILSWVPYLQILSEGPSYGDEGLIAQSAYRIYQGQVPFRDFFSAITPGSYYWSSFFMKAFGPTFLALRLSALAAVAIVLAGTMLVIRRFGTISTGPYLVASSYLAYYGGPYWFVASHHWVSVALCIVSFLLLLPSDDKIPSHARIVAAGVAASAAAFSMQHQGVLWMLSATAGIWAFPKVSRKSSIIWFWGGVLLFALPVAFLFIAAAGWQTVSYDLIQFPLKQYHKMEGHRGTIIQYIQEVWQQITSAWHYRSSLLDLVRIIAWNLGFVGHIMVHLLPFIGLAALASLWKTRVYSSAQLGCLTGFYVAMYLTSLNRLSDTSLGFAAPSAVIAVALSLDATRQANLPWQKLGLYAGRIWILLFTAIATAYFAFTVLSPKATTFTPAGPVLSLYSGEHETLQGVDAFFRTDWQQNEPIFCYPYSPIFYFLFHADNPTPYDTLTYPMHTQAQLEESLAILEKRHCRWIIWNASQLGDNSFDLFLSGNFTIKAKFKYAAILERQAK